VAVEVMANSDNVLRGGLTSKHIDVIELLAVLDFTPITPAALRPPMHRDGRRLIYAPPVDEFAVSMWTLGDRDVGTEMPVLQHDSGPHIMLCATGAVTVRDRRSTELLQRGEAMWISADDPPVCLRADMPSTVFATGVPSAAESPASVDRNVENRPSDASAGAVEVPPLA
jgi:mannose-6-phosphate isomerase